MHGAGRRLRQGAPAVRPAHRDVRGGQAPLRQHAGGQRTGHGQRVGRGPGRRGGRRPTHLHRGHGGACWRSRRPTSAPTSTSRCTGASASPGSTTPTSTCAGPPRSRRWSTPRRRPIDVAAAVRGGTQRVAHHRPAARGRADARRGAGLRRAGQGDGRVRAAGGHDRDRVRDAALAQRPGAATPARWSSS